MKIDKNRAIKKATSNFLFLKDNSEWNNDIDVVKAAILNDQKSCVNNQVFKYIHPDLLKSKELSNFLLNEIKDCSVIKHMDITIREDLEEMDKFIQKNIQSFEYCGNDLKNNIAFVTPFVLKNPSIFCYAGEKIKNNREIALTITKSDISIIRHCDKTILSDREIAMQVIKQNGLMIRYFDAIFTQDFEIVMAAVQQDGLSLKYAHDTMKKTRKLF